MMHTVSDYCTLYSPYIALPFWNLVLDTFLQTLCLLQAVAETWRRVWGDGKMVRGPRFLKNLHFHTENF